MIGSRLRFLRQNAGRSQASLAKELGVTQSAINRYEHNEAQAPYKTLLWYADHFDVSMDYIFGRTDDPYGRYYNAQPRRIREQFRTDEEWKTFIETCFTEGTQLNHRLKDILLRLAEDQE